MDAPSSVNIPRLTMVAVVDKSGSMGIPIDGGKTKLALIKETVVASVDILNSFHRISLLAFDADA